MGCEVHRVGPSRARVMRGRDPRQPECSVEIRGMGVSCGGGGYAAALAPLDTSLDPRADVPIRLSAQHRFPVRRLRQPGCHRRMSIGGRSRASALASARPRRRNRLPRKRPDWRCSSRRRLGGVHDDDEGKFEGGGGWHSPSLDGAVEVCVSPSVPFRDPVWYPGSWLSRPAQRFRFVSITSREDEISRRSTNKTDRQLSKGVRNGNPDGGSFRAEGPCACLIGPSGSQGQSHRNSTVREGAEECGRSWYVRTVYERQRQRGYAWVPAPVWDYAAAAAYNLSPGTSLVAHHILPNGYWLACELTSPSSLPWSRSGHEHFHLRCAPIGEWTGEGAAVTGSGGHRAAGGERLGAVESSNLTTPRPPRTCAGFQIKQVPIHISLTLFDAATSLHPVQHAMPNRLTSPLDSTRGTQSIRSPPSGPPASPPTLHRHRRAQPGLGEAGGCVGLYRHVPSLQAAGDVRRPKCRRAGRRGRRPSSRAWSFRGFDRGCAREDPIDNHFPSEQPQAWVSHRSGSVSRPRT